MFLETKTSDDENDLASTPTVRRPVGFCITNVSSVRLNAQQGSNLDGDGSRTAVILELTKQLAAFHALVFFHSGVWQGEEDSHFGSTDYITRLSKDEYAHIKLYLDLGKRASPNSYFDSPETSILSHSLGLGRGVRRGHQAQ
jgi:hypothetical protein